jgi:hypothetical protein
VELESVVSWESSRSQHSTPRQQRAGVEQCPKSVLVGRLSDAETGTQLLSPRNWIKETGPNVGVGFPGRRQSSQEKPARPHLRDADFSLMWIASGWPTIQEEFEDHPSLRRVTSVRWQVLDAPECKYGIQSRKCYHLTGSRPPPVKESMVADHGSPAENSGRNLRITVSRSFA